MMEDRPHLGTIKEDDNDNGTEAPESQNASPNNSNEHQVEQIKSKGAILKGVGVSPKINDTLDRENTGQTSPRLTE